MTDFISGHAAVFAFIGMASVALAAVILFLAGLSVAVAWIDKRLGRTAVAPMSTPPVGHACPELLRLRDDHIRASLRALGDELRADPDLHLDTLDGLFASRPHTTDH